MNFSLTWLIEQAFRRTKALQRSVPFRIWIGAVKYAPELGVAQMQLQRINALSQGGAELSGAETRESLQWLASTLLEPHGSAYAEIVGPLLERLQIGELGFRSQSRALNALMEGSRRLSPSETSGALRWFASTLLQLRDPTFTQMIAPALRVSPREQAYYQAPAPRTEQLTHNLSLQFDASVSPEKRIRFLVALADQVSQAGGRLCFAQERAERA